MRQAFMFVTLLFVLVYFSSIHVIAAPTETEFQPVEVKVILERVYIDGETSQEYVKETVYSLEDFWAKYKDWHLVDMSEKEVVFRRHVDDISPLLKTNGYFGITDEGILTIYNGKPEHSKIIHSFFQIDIEKLESNKHEELKEGIPITNKAQYEKVLETFRNYTVTNKE